MAYTPPPEIIDKYADVLINFALGGGTGIKKGDVVGVSAQESAKPLYVALCRAVWRSGGHVLPEYIPDEADRYGNLRDIFDTATTDEQFDYFPDKYFKGIIDTVDHHVTILSDADLHALEKVDPKRIMQKSRSRYPYSQWRTEKENQGKYTWTLALYGTPAMAAEAKMSEEEYWEQIINACFLDEADPIAKWREVEGQIKETVEKLDALKIEKLHVVGEDVDLWVKLGHKRRWMGGSGRNIPSFEVFTSPDWRGSEGWITFNIPLYYNGSMVEGIRLEFKEGRVVSATASKNQQILQEMIKAENADKMGEYSLTDKRLSRITKFMAETLFDENMGGPYGNTHLAVGKSYHDCYEGDPAVVTQEEWAEMGYNDSAVHTDMFSTTDRTVTATLPDGSERVIYKDGQFTV